MKNRARLLPALMIVAAGAACDSPSEAGSITGRYWLEQYGGLSMPLVNGPYEEFRDGEFTGVICTDTTHSQYLELKSNAKAALVSDQSLHCNGRAPERTKTELPGTWTTSRDSVALTFTAPGGEIGPVTWTWDAALDDDRLVISFPVYTEEDPEGINTPRYTWIYRKR